MELIINAIARTLDNTFIGTFLAGLLIAYFGLKIYRKQKELDVEYSKRKKTQELATSLLTNVNVAVKDYLGQIGVHDGSNQVAKAVYSKMESLSPGIVSKEASNKFSLYVANITNALNELGTPLTLDPKNTEKVKVLNENVPVLTFLLSMASTLPDLPISTLKEIRKQTDDYFSKIKKTLEDIVGK